MPQAVKMEKQEYSDVCDHDAKQLCAVMREERAEKLARAGMANNAAWRRRTMPAAMAVLRSAVTKQ